MSRKSIILTGWPRVVAQFAGAAVFGLAGWWMSGDLAPLLIEGERTSGVVVGRDRHQRAGTAGTSYAVIAEITISGERQTVRSVMGGTNPPAIGETVEVRYHPKAGGKAVIGSPLPAYAFLIGFPAVGVLLLASALRGAVAQARRSIR